MLLGLVQGLTEFLPVSRFSGICRFSNTLFGLQGEENLTFAVAVHAATSLQYDRRVPQGIVGS